MMHSVSNVGRRLVETAALTRAGSRRIGPIRVRRPNGDVIRTRGTKYKLIQHHCCYDLRKFNFTNRVIPIWNSLSNHVVSADTVKTV